MPFLIDGYNLYHAARKITEEWSQLVPMALCRMIAEDMQRLRDGAIVVFDGAAPRGRPADVEPVGYVRIVYSGPKSDADTVLEQMIQQNTAPRRLAVVSTDRRVRQAARRRRAVSLRSEEYLLSLVRRLDQPPRRGDPPEKRQGVPEGQLNEWLEMFGIEPGEADDESGMIEF